MQENKPVGLVIIVALVVGYWSQPVDGLEVRKADGGTIKTDLGYGIILNENSTLRRQFVAVLDDLPIEFVGVPGVRTIYEKGTRYRSGDYKYASGTTIVVTHGPSATAFEVRFATYDVFGNRVETLSATEIEDISVGRQRTYDWKWRLYNENDASRYFASLAWVARVRTSDGKVHFANHENILDVMRQFSADATEADLDPTPKKQ